MSAQPLAGRVAIIGAGPAGLAAAYDLTRAGRPVTVYEAAPQVGGLAAGFKAPGWEWSLEKFYHHWFASDRAILGLIDELGWRDQVLFPRPYTVIFHQGQFHPFDDIFSNMPRFLLRHFPLGDVIRFGLAGAYLRFSPFWRPLETVTAAAWTRRWFGERIYNLFWRPMLVGKFGEANLEVVNMAWLWARLHSRTTRLGTFQGGFQAFLDRLAEVVRAQGAEVRLNTPATQVRPAPDGGWLVASAAGEARYSAVLSTASPEQMARLAPDLPAAYTAQLRGLQSMGAVVMVLALKRQLTQYYWHNLPKEAGFPFLALVEHTNYLDRAHYGGDHIIYCGDYLEPGHEYFRLSDAELLERYLPGIQRFNPEFDRSWIRQTWVWKAAYAQPVPPVNHARNIPAVRTPLPGLYFASMSQVYPWDRGTNFAVEIGRQAAKLLLQDTR